jgi:hypothetical protein
LVFFRNSGGPRKVPIWVIFLTRIWPDSGPSRGQKKALFRGPDPDPARSRPGPDSGSENCRSGSENLRAGPGQDPDPGSRFSCFPGTRVKFSGPGSNFRDRWQNFRGRGEIFGTWGKISGGQPDFFGPDPKKNPWPGKKLDHRRSSKFISDRQVPNFFLCPENFLGAKTFRIKQNNLCSFAENSVARRTTYWRARMYHDVRDTVKHFSKNK